MSNLTAKDLYGCMTALVTPMNKQGKIHLEQWKNLLRKQIAAKVKAVVVAGTTGESAVLTDDEFIQLLTVAVEQCQGTQTAVIAQTGSISADKVITNNKVAYELGAQAVLVVTPYYLRTTQEGLYQHFKKIADVSALPVILYNVPTRTQNDLLPTTCKRLSLHDNIIGLKEASPDEQRITELVKTIHTSGFNIMSGCDDTFVDSIAQGALGVISVASNVRPQIMTRICNYMALGDTISAKKLNSSLDNLYKVLSCQPNPIPVKYLMHEAALIDEGIRLPLVWFDDKKASTSDEILKIKQDYSNL
jgi:4-hydroxy-tetrahydrodipicolinate synthase